MLVEAINSANIGYLADLYHLAKMGEDVADVLSVYRDTIWHVLGLEYVPDGASGDSFWWLRPEAGTETAAP